MSYQNFPQDVTSLNRWMVTKEGSKKPYDPETVSRGDWQDSSNRGSFLSAWMAVWSGRADQLGFVNEQAQTGLMFLDLDNKPSNPATEKQLAFHADILMMTDGTYCEHSASTVDGYEGFHIIVRCGVPLLNINREHIEYRPDGFTVLTGWTVTGEPMPVLNGVDNNLSAMHKLLAGDRQIVLPIQSEPETRSDDELWNVLENSANNEKLFQLKMGGDSHTDYDIACWITKLTRNREQAARLLRRTPYAQGKKSDGTVLASSDYHVYRVIDRALLETQVPAIDISKLIRPVQLPSPLPDRKAIRNPMQIERMPEGWCKEFAKFTLANSMSPLEEAAVFCSFLPVAGVGGRFFSASNTGLNQQFTLLALTGTGKDEAVNAAQRVLSKVTLQEPGVAIQAFVADDFASAQGIHRALAAQPVMFGYNKESGMWMERMSKPNPDEHMLMINSVILDIYNLHGKYLKGRKYAKKDNDLDSVYSPTLSTLSVSTPRQFYEYMTIKMLDTGITGRELIFECEDTEAKSRSYSYVVPEAPYNVTEGLIRLAVLARKNIADITFGPHAVLPNGAETNDLMNHWELEYLKMQNSDDDDIHRAIWSRANLKMRKLAATMAVSYAMMHPVGDTMQTPLIAPEHVRYAVEVVNYCSSQLQAKLKMRGIGNLYVQQEELFEEAVEWYFGSEANLFTQFKNEDIKQRMWKAREDGVIFKSQIMPRLAGKAAFSGHNRSTAVELERTLKNKFGSGLYVQIDTKQMQEMYGVRSEAFGRVG